MRVRVRRRGTAGGEGGGVSPFPAFPPRAAPPRGCAPPPPAPPPRGGGPPGGGGGRRSALFWSFPRPPQGWGLTRGGGRGGPPAAPPRGPPPPAIPSQPFRMGATGDADGRPPTRTP